MNERCCFVKSNLSVLEVCLFMTLILIVQCDNEVVSVPLPHQVLWFVPPTPLEIQFSTIHFASVKNWLLCKNFLLPS